MLRGLSVATPGARVDRCLATYEALAESRCEGLAFQACLDGLAREAEADLVLLRRVDDDAVDLLAYENVRTPWRRARLDRSLGRSLPMPTCTWLLDGRLTVEPSHPWDLRAEPPKRVPFLDLRPIRRYVGRGGVAVLELLREANPDITDEVDVAARPRHVGVVVSLYHDFE